MPYKLAKQGNQTCVVKKDGTVVKCHPTRERAVRHLRALYANVEDAKGGEGSGNFNHEGCPGLIGVKGGEGSGNHGHAGRPGLVGGSAREGGSGSKPLNAFWEAVGKHPANQPMQSNEPFKAGDKVTPSILKREGFVFYRHSGQSSAMYRNQSSKLQIVVNSDPNTGKPISVRSISKFTKD